MPSLTVREALTELAGHLRAVYGRDAGDVVEAWRDRKFPVVVKHRWNLANRRSEGFWVNRECKRCGLIDQFGVMPDGKEAAHYVLADGSVVQKSPNPTPPCRLSTGTAPSLSRSRKE